MIALEASKASAMIEIRRPRPKAVNQIQTSM
jgi:phage FluMu protein Com